VCIGIREMMMVSVCARVCVCVCDKANDVYVSRRPTWR
jgi:hypothetical protein